MTGRVSGLGCDVAVLLIEKERDGVEAGAVDGADLRDRRVEFARQLEHVDMAAARLHEVGHVEQHQRGQADGEHRQGEHELTRQMKRVQNQQNSVGLGRAGHAAAQHVDGDARVFRVRSERVDAGQVDEREIFAAHAGHQSHALLDGDAGVVGDFLAQARELVEECGFAGVGRADENHRFESALGRGAAGGLKPASHSRRSSRSLGQFGSFFGGVAAAVAPVQGRTRMAAAVSWRSAISMPSMQ